MEGYQISFLKMVLRDEKIDNTLFLKSRGKYLLIVQVYVDAIDFKKTSYFLFEEYANIVGSEFEMSLMGALSIFLDMQTKQISSRTMIC